ncbi:50S ribosomal protein L24 [Sulfuriflexus sp.]|uniref:50S ribosomal protein L24 n=1 Tax=Sulfuriflexus sp. TaxID=2015443 RepID=UPI0028CBC215|nr:50S ribosomal protein L24 [Sulfuriflexus sp.]MDT8403793.1 50S ribosomal protein L24 [Sulfuriflexus sp.]
MNRIKKGDEVVVLTGKDKGRRGNVIRIMDDNRVLVENINMAKRHTKANPQIGIAGGIIEKEMPLHASNVGLYNPATGKADRIGFKVLDDGRKVRYFKSNNEVVDA